MTLATSVGIGVRGALMGTCCLVDDSMEAIRIWEESLLCEGKGSPDMGK